MEYYRFLYDNGHPTFRCVIWKICLVDKLMRDSHIYSWYEVYFKYLKNMYLLNLENFKFFWLEALALHKAFRNDLVIKELVYRCLL